ncbi:MULTISPECIES: LacI family DNA-binding transcriptional regulator [Aliiglaciecola]|uniref:LacI family DNA-binding transcriptional regulator n=1 Tax=Aliiglaciecola TaxID=1406885 RepID=UPI001C08CA8D|nr:MULTISPECIES: LacI family DNA-binding transcriptional regulator [Aliiglaciecola]MBU2878984.1 LacI family DNA-binding transcriptional regulator [Aliiglaciecola lipolytica]MDO6710685.1 LacI family DNA-binding transcriptional regulator [Aliiglaciecola sp. 2_MG-2023]MDO6751907.1 LacI family DNA-binding transcriptional regulator [Aliiglaciecola sp. 1_MG-2023]
MSENHKQVAAASDVAKLAGVSQSAVSRTFTEGASVSLKTRNKVIEAAQQLGYRPNLLARSLLKGKSNIVGVVLGNLENPFYSQILDVLSTSLSAGGKRLLVFTVGANAEADAQIDEMLQYRVDALILMSTTLSSSLAKQCQSAGIPVVFLNRTGQFPECWAVTGDNQRGSHLIGKHLIDCGYQRIAFMAGYVDSSTSSEREQAFSQYIQEQGRPAPIREVGHFSRQGALAAARRLLALPQPPDAIFCANDHMAMACLDVAKFEFDLEPGKDIGIVGFDDVSAASWPSFELTTFSQPVALMAQKAAELIINPALVSQQAEHFVVPGELLIRSSTVGKTK